MDNQDQRDGLCEDLAELFGALPRTNNATTDRTRWARELILDLIRHKLDRRMSWGWSGVERPLKTGID